jgi:hypothetical protein
MSFGTPGAVTLDARVKRLRQRKDRCTVAGNRPVSPVSRWPSGQREDGGFEVKGH